jgi:nitrite reductase/ring-hydroxylating ferredoxin subunit
MLTKFVEAAKKSQVPDGTMLNVKVENEDILIACVDGAYYAINNLCSHQGGWLDQGELLTESCEVLCPLHDGAFDLKTGEPTAEPCKEPVAAYAVKIEGDTILVGPRD